MSQSTITLDPAVDTGTTLVTKLNGFRDALLSQHVGTTRPTYITKGGVWVKDDGATELTVYLFDGANDGEIAKMNTTTGKITITGDGVMLNPTATQTITGTPSTNLALKEGATQAGNVLEVQDTGGTTKFSVDKDGVTTSERYESNATGTDEAFKAGTNFSVKGDGSGYFAGLIDPQKGIQGRTDGHKFSGTRVPAGQVGEWLYMEQVNALGAVAIPYAATTQIGSEFTVPSGVWAYSIVAQKIKITSSLGSSIVLRFQGLQGGQAPSAMITPPIFVATADVNMQFDGQVSGFIQSDGTETLSIAVYYYQAGPSNATITIEPNTATEKTLLVLNRIA